MDVKKYLLSESKFKLEDFKETILKLEDTNQDMTLRLLYAKLVGEKRLEEVMKSINNIVDFEHGSGDIKDYIYKKEKSLHELGRKKYGKQYWNENIYNPSAVNESLRTTFVFTNKGMAKRAYDFVNKSKAQILQYRLKDNAIESKDSETTELIKNVLEDNSFNYRIQ